MPLVDRRTDSVVLRIVYDGPPESGKTTNLRVLCDRLSLGRRGELHSPGGGERTQFFDWLDVTGGYVGGRRLRCQLVTVPGQVELARRRRYLLDTADVVVFVADTRPEAIDGARAMLDTLRRVIAARDAIPLLVQANKQDVTGALAVGQVASALAIGEDVPMVAAQACHGVGVLETFMLGVRLAVDRIRLALVRGQIAEGVAGSATTLLSELQDAEAALESVAAAAAGAALVAAEPEPIEAPAAAPPAVHADHPPLPRGDIATGLVWPPQSGRFALRSLDDERAGGAVVEAIAADELRCGSWRLFHRAAGADSDAARAALLTAVARQPAFGALVPASRTIALGADDRGGRHLWYLVEHARSLADAASEGDDDLDERVAAADDLAGRLGAIAGRVGIDAAIDARLISDDGQRYLGPLWPGAGLDAEAARQRLRASLPLRRPVRDDDLEISEVDALGTRDDEMVPVDGPDELWTLPTVGLPAGMVWPQVRGRLALSSLGAQGARSRLAPRAWSPDDAIEVPCSEWIAHTAPTWWFDDLDDGRRELLEAVRWQTRLGRLTPDGRTLALAPSDDGARLWMLTPDLPSCWDWIERAIRDGDRAAVDAQTTAALAALDAIRAELARLGVDGDLALDVIAVADGPRLLLPVPAVARRGGGARLAAQLARIEAYA